MNRLSQITLLLATGIGADGIGAQESRGPSNQWLLESYRPVVGVQLCENPSVESRADFDGTTEECKAEFDRLFVKCTTELPNVRLASEFKDREEQVAAVALLYECVSSHYIGGATLKEFNRRYPPESQTDPESGD